MAFYGDYYLQRCLYEALAMHRGFPGLVASWEYRDYCLVRIKSDDCSKNSPISEEPANNARRYGSLASRHPSHSCAA